jgi:hypothetical protein
VINATGIGLKPPGRAKTLGIPKPLRAIRLKCLDCTYGQEAHIRDCTLTSCPLWPYRMGRYPKAVESMRETSLGEQDRRGVIAERLVQ